MPSSRSARVHCCVKFCHHFSNLYLFVINLIDFGLACVLLSFALYLFSKLGKDWTNPHTAWLLWSDLLISFLLFVISLSSSLAVVTFSCRCLVGFTDLIAVLIILLDLSVGIASIELQAPLLQYLDDNQASIGLTDQDLSLLRTWYLVIAYGFFLSLFLESIRVLFNRGYSERSRRIDQEYASLLKEEDRRWEVQFQSKTDETKSKYDNLRSQYKQKYAKPVANFRGVSTDSQV